MWKSEGYAWLLGAALVVAAVPGRAQAPVPAPATASRSVAFDTANSWLGFEVRTRFGQRMAGEFPRYEGVVEHLPDGRHRVRLRVATSEAVIPDRPRYTAWMRSQSFFDAIRHPWMEFVSEPYAPELLRDGGVLRGRLDLRGINRDEELTPREQEVVKLVAEAHTNKEIAAILHLSEKTVENHRSNAMRKLGMRDRVELVRYAIRRGLIEP